MEQESSAPLSVAARAQVFAALSSPVRLQIMLWLVDPRPHFAAQIDGDLVTDGVCVGRIVDKLDLSQPTVSAHMKKLAAVGLVRGKKINNWIFYKPQRAVLAELGGLLDVLAQARGDEA